MDFKVSFQVNEKLFIKNPESSVTGKHIIEKSVELIHNLGFEHFTFKKLSIEINCTEATIYRYFENKHKLLLYILNWYWSFIEFLVMFKLQNITNAKQKLEIILELLTSDLPENNNKFDYNKKNLTNIIIRESTKAYLIKEVDFLNKDEFFKPYKDLCQTISSIILEYNPKYQYPHSISSTIIETAHTHEFFSFNLPKLTDIENHIESNFTYSFLHQLLFKTISF